VTWIFRIFLTSISILPFPVLHFLSSISSVFLGRVFRYRRSIVLDNLGHSFPEKSNREIKVIADKFYLHLCDVIFETIKMLTMSKAELKRRVRPVNPEVFPEMTPGGQGGIGILSHYANWEWLGAGMGCHLSSATCGIYKAQSGKAADKLLLHIRTRFGNRMIEKKSSVREILKGLKEPTYFGILGDQNPTPGQPMYFTDFLGRAAPVEPGIASLALQTGRPVYFSRMKRGRRGFYEVFLERLPIENYLPKSDENVRRFTDLHVRMLEEMIRAKPEYWLWSHRRWKHQPEKVRESD